MGRRTDYHYGEVETLSDGLAMDLVGEVCDWMQVEVPSASMEVVVSPESFADV